MAKTQWTLLFVTFSLSCISLAFFIVSIGTPHWILASTENEMMKRPSKINYGLFAGTSIVYELQTPFEFCFRVVCDSQTCMYSCQNTDDKRKEELRSILNGSCYSPCEQIRSARSIPNFIDDSEQECAAVNKDELINSHLWSGTVVFISFGIFFAVISALVSLINVISSPVLSIFSAFGLYVWNGAAIFSSLLTLCLWGALFDLHLTNNIAISDTLLPSSLYYSKSKASLGYSYWIVWCPMLLHSINIALLVLRKVLNDRLPPAPTITIERSDGTIMLY